MISYLSLIHICTSYVYPLSSIGSHVSAIPNHQVFRNTPLHTRANVAYFGTFGYELDLNELSLKEREEVMQEVQFMKKYRSLFQFGTFYRLRLSLIHISKLDQHQISHLFIQPVVNQKMFWLRKTSTLLETGYI